MAVGRDGDGGVVQDVEDANTAEGGADGVGEEGESRGGVGGWEAEEVEVELGQCVDCDEDVGRGEGGGVPEEEPSCGEKSVS